MATAYRITLEIDTEGPPIHGQLLAAPDRPRSFTGWTSLLAALDAAISGEQVRPDGKEEPRSDQPRPQRAR